MVASTCHEIWSTMLTALLYLIVVDWQRISIRVWHRHWSHPKVIEVSILLTSKWSSWIPYSKKFLSFIPPKWPSFRWSNLSQPVLWLLTWFRSVHLYNIYICTTYTHVGGISIRPLLFRWAILFSIHTYMYMHLHVYLRVRIGGNIACPYTKSYLL